jgi:hypothetical protein
LSATPPTTTHTEALENGNGAAEVDTSSLVAGVGDACTNCGAKLAPEQRYCVECGERRGQSRLPFAEHIGQRTTPTAAAAPPPKQRGPRLGSGGALIAGVATLILALGVGVLIGKSGDNGGNKNSGSPQIIRVPAAAAAGVAAAGSGATTAAASTGKGGAKKAKAKDNSKPVSQAEAKKNPAADTKQRPGQTTPPSVVKVGSPGHGKGYKNGKFTGDFFGQ